MGDSDPCWRLPSEIAWTEALSGDLSIRCAQRRHVGLRVETTAAAARFVKLPIDEAGARCLDREHAMVTALARATGFASAPRVLASEGRGSKVVIALETGMIDLRLASDRVPRIVEQVAESLGAALSELHALDADSLFDAPAPQAEVDLRPDLPWVEDLRFLTPAAIEFIAAVQRDAQICAALADLAERWQPRCLIHADLRMDNVLVGRRPGDKPVLVDWECAGLGDPARDVGSLLGEIMRVWLQRPGVRRRMPPPEGAAAARAFWRGYTGSVDPGTAAAHAGLWLLQIGLERTLSRETRDELAAVLHTAARSLLVDAARDDRRLGDHG